MKLLHTTTFTSSASCSLLTCLEYKKCSQMRTYVDMYITPDKQCQKKRWEDGKVCVMYNNDNHIWPKASDRDSSMWCETDWSESKKESRWLGVTCRPIMSFLKAILRLQLLQHGFPLPLLLLLLAMTCRFRLCYKRSRKPKQTIECFGFTFLSLFSPWSWTSCCWL